MRHLFPILGFLTLGLISCSGCTKKDTTPVCTGEYCNSSVVPVISQPDATPDSLNQTLSGEGWELVVPEGFNLVTTEDKEQPEVLVLNEDEHSLILLTKEPFLDSASEFVLAAVKGAAEVEGTINATKHVELNGNKYVLLDVTSGETRIWMWLIVKNGFGYSLSCGGPKDEDHHEALCNEVANSLKIK